MLNCNDERKTRICCKRSIVGCDDTPPALEDDTDAVMLLNDTTRARGVFVEESDVATVVGGTIGSTIEKEKNNASRIRGKCLAREQLKWSMMYSTPLKAAARTYVRDSDLLRKAQTDKQKH